MAFGLLLYALRHNEIKYRNGNPESIAQLKQTLSEAMVRSKFPPPTTYNFSLTYATAGVYA